LENFILPFMYANANVGIPPQMLMVNKEAQQKQDKDSSPAAIPKQGEIENQIERI